ncbi:DUF4373 domain-containing protein [Bacteroides cellulosilyticus]|uniref:DUF4373 domain-containing protein n=1 Tax=Bacteroides cellulosilyticus TaxID=246787 RepID=UPI001C3761DF|nr:DUF4373 domain-containing protein [Bacteroides cellulosilyticus]MBV3635183.1 DUF4373 domain-containing protein [Bacteroides cellulosilyticus]MBV3661454.1 DUF4373 domain-containing protein [Bacteroides cellulosilyticus]MBV3683739.1 DUF4373 domain-containing protein [Bacteroides cellulosilyticus]MBV3691772.1 DUF4373 domain-containing protein [Bacteroides cellulosilyticus]MBV3705609.1 DUF4373 domain-containing protein [Bacteroides cellulosilyticus]
MSRIKKRGLDYFPLDIDFLQNRLVRRIMKREGDGALATLVSAFSCIYGGEGYYVLTDAFFYEDISANLYHQTAEDVKRILTLAAEYGIFDVTLFRECGVLTSAGIQRQYLFSTKRRKSSAIDNRFNLITDEQEDDAAAGKQEETAGLFPETSVSLPEASAALVEVSTTLPESAVDTFQNVTLISENVASGTHSIAQNSIAQNSIAQQSIEYPLLNSSPSGRTQDADRESAEGDGEEENFLSSPEIPASFAAPATFAVPVSPAVPVSSAAHASSAVPPSVPPASSVAPLRHPRKEWTDEDICRMQPPPDGLNRNLDGLLFNLRQLRISPPEQRAIILKSNFGVIGHPMWKGFSTIRESCGKIRQPGRFLLSLCNKTGVHEV